MALLLVQDLSCLGPLEHFEKLIEEREAMATTVYRQKT